MDFGSRIKELRKASHLTQQELADITKVDRTTVSKWESNENIANKDILDCLCDYFAVSMDYLLGRTDDPTIQPPPAKSNTNTVTIIGRGSGVKKVELDDDQMDMIRAIIDTFDAKNSTKPKKEY